MEVTIIFQLINFHLPACVRCLSKPFTYTQYRQAAFKFPSPGSIVTYRRSSGDEPLGVAVNALIISAGHFEVSDLPFHFYRLKKDGFELGIASINNNCITA